MDINKNQTSMSNNAIIIAPQYYMFKPDGGRWSVDEARRLFFTLPFFVASRSSMLLNSQQEESLNKYVRSLSLTITSYTDSATQEFAEQVEEIKQRIIEHDEGKKYISQAEYAKYSDTLTRLNVAACYLTARQEKGGMNTLFYELYKEGTTLNVIGFFKEACEKRDFNLFNSEYIKHWERVARAKGIQLGVVQNTATTQPQSAK